MTTAAGRNEPPDEPPREPPSAVRRFHTPLRGHAFAGPVPAAALTPDRPVSLVREPANPADPLAVAVWVTDDEQRAWRVGYLDRTVAARLAPRLDAGTPVHGVLEGWIEEPGGRWERPLVRLEVAATPERGTDAESVRATVWGRPPGMRRRHVEPPS